MSLSPLCLFVLIVVFGLSIVLFVYSPIMLTCYVYVRICISMVGFGLSMFS